MTNDHYTKQLFIAEVNTEDVIMRPVERWEAHKQGILHRGFTVVMMFQGCYFLQHRKHPAFDHMWDLTFSSHQIYVENTLQTDEEAIYENMHREWNISKNDVVGKLEYKGKVYYKAQDPQSIFTEHEIDYIYLANLNCEPTPNLEYAYGYNRIDEKGNIKELLAKFTLTPWVEKIIEEITL